MIDRDNRGFWVITKAGRIGPFIRSAEAYEYIRQNPEPEEPAEEKPVRRQRPATRETED